MTDTGTFGHAPAYRCEVCHGTAEWRLERYGDAVVTWSDTEHMAEVVAAGQRVWEQTRIVVTPFTLEGR